MTLRNFVVSIVWIFVFALAIKLAWWAYQKYVPDAPVESAQEVLEVDMECWVIPDTGQCFCRHRWTEERLSVPYKQCVRLARRR